MGENMNERYIKEVVKILKEQELIIPDEERAYSKYLAEIA